MADNIRQRKRIDESSASSSKDGRNKNIEEGLDDDKYRDQSSLQSYVMLLFEHKIYSSS